MKIIPAIAQAHDEIQALRRDIHAHPELRYEEERTAGLVAQKLQEWDIEVTRGLEIGRASCRERVLVAV